MLGARRLQSYAPLQCLQNHAEERSRRTKPYGFHKIDRRMIVTASSRQRTGVAAPTIYFLPKPTKKLNLVIDVIVAAMRVCSVHPSVSGHGFRKKWHLLSVGAVHIEDSLLNLGAVCNVQKGT